MIRFRPTSISLCEKDLQCHLERILLRHHNRVVELHQQRLDQSDISYGGDTVSLDSDAFFPFNSSSFEASVSDSHMNPASDTVPYEDSPQTGCEGDSSPSPSPSPSSSYGTSTEWICRRLVAKTNCPSLVSNAQEKGGTLLLNRKLSSFVDVRYDVLLSPQSLQNDLMQFLHHFLLNNPMRQQYSSLVMQLSHPPTIQSEIPMLLDAPFSTAYESPQSLFRTQQTITTTPCSLVMDQHGRRVFLDLPLLNIFIRLLKNSGVFPTCKINPLSSFTQLLGFFSISLMDNNISSQASPGAEPPPRPLTREEIYRAELMHFLMRGRPKPFRESFLEFISHPKPDPKDTAELPHKPANASVPVNTAKTEKHPVNPNKRVKKNHNDEKESLFATTSRKTQVTRVQHPSVPMQDHQGAGNGQLSWSPEGKVGCPVNIAKDYLAMSHDPSVAASNTAHTHVELEEHRPYIRASTHRTHENRILRKPVVHLQDKPPGSGEPYNFADSWLFTERFTPESVISEPVDWETIVTRSAEEDAVEFTNYVDALLRELDNPPEDRIENFGLNAIMGEGNHY